MLLCVVGSRFCCGVLKVSKKAMFVASSSSGGSSYSKSLSLGADPSLVTDARSAVAKVLSGAFSRETLISRSHGRGFSVQEMRLSASCCVYGRQKWRRCLTAVCVAGECGVEFVDAEFAPPGSGRTRLLSPGESLQIPPGQAYYLHGQLQDQAMPGDALWSTEARLVLLAVPPLDECEVQDVDGSFPTPPSPPAPVGKLAA